MGYKSTLPTRPVLLTFILASLLIFATVVVGCGSDTVRSAPNPSASNVKPTSSSLQQTNEAGNVGIVVTWENPSGEGSASLRFIVAMNTHSVDLDGYDLSKLAVLRNDQGVEASPDGWDAPKGGHHRSGVLSFSNNIGGKPIIGTETRTIELIIRDVAGVRERIFRWEVPR